MYREDVKDVDQVEGYEEANYLRIRSGISMNNKTNI